jgi:hypothetical protein
MAPQGKLHTSVSIVVWILCSQQTESKYLINAMAIHTLFNVDVFMKCFKIVFKANFILEHQLLH